AQDIADSADAKQRAKCFDDGAIYTIAIHESSATFVLAQQLQALLTLHIVNAHERVHIVDVVNPGDMLIANTLNIMDTVAVIVESGALDWLQADDLVIGKGLFEPIPCCNRPGTAHR